MAFSTKQVLLVEYVAGAPKEQNFKTVTASINSDDLKDGDVLLKVLYLSVDPYMRMRMSHVEGYTSMYPLNQPIDGAGVAKVVKSKNSKYNEGDFLVGFGIQWAEYCIMNPDYLGQKIDSASQFPLSYYLNVLGMTGLTAYFGLLDVCAPKENEVVVVSTAAGAVGYVVGQIARIRGCKVIGITGSDEKVKLLKEKLHFDEVINYKTSSNIRDSLVAALKVVNPSNPKIDVYFDNVGGETLDAVFSLLNAEARVSICGQVSQYNKYGTNEERYGIKNIGNLLLTKSKVQGFMIPQYVARYPQGMAEIEGWLKSGKLQSIEDVVVGLDKIAEAFIGMMGGENVGKRVIKVADA